MISLKYKASLIFLCILFGVSYVQTGLLFFPAPSVLQITSSLAIPIVIPGRKIYIDYGLQFNYDLPSNVSSFYNLKIWPTSSGRKRDVTAHEKDWHSTLGRYDHQRGEQRLYHPHDFTAGEFYQSVENSLMRYGFHETCLLRSICELARHPFADGEENILTETLTFMLTPSLHNAFAETESVYREVYEQAEQHGFFGADCESLYNECKVDILSGLTKIVLGK